MDEEDGFRLVGDALLDFLVVNLKGFRRGLHQTGNQPVFGNGEDGRDIGIGGHDDLITGMQKSHLDICTIDESEGVEPIAHTDTKPSTHILGICLLKQPEFISKQIPA